MRLLNPGLNMFVIVRLYSVGVCLQVHMIQIPQSIIFVRIERLKSSGLC